MCLAIPAQVVAVVDAPLGLVKVDVSGVRRNVNTLLLETIPPVGAWVLIHVGFAMSLIDEAEALRARATLEQLGQAYRSELDELRTSAIQ
jgi:hydrogenase expression/formation protein HypC